MKTQKRSATNVIGDMKVMSLIIIVILLLALFIFFYLNKTKFYVPKVNRTLKEQLGDLAPVCGNNKCEQGEYSFNCCLDCGCPHGYVCKSNKCVVNEELVKISRSKAIKIFKQELTNRGYIIKDVNKIMLEKQPGGYIACYDISQDLNITDQVCLMIYNNGSVSNVLIRTT